MVCIQFNHNQTITKPCFYTHTQTDTYKEPFILKTKVSINQLFESVPNTKQSRNHLCLETMINNKQSTIEPYNSAYPKSLYQYSLDQTKNTIVIQHLSIKSSINTHKSYPLINKERKYTFNAVHKILLQQSLSFFHQNSILSGHIRRKILVI